jgi:hypothetical protein
MVGKRQVPLYSCVVCFAFVKMSQTRYMRSRVHILVIPLDLTKALRKARDA